MQILSYPSAERRITNTIQNIDSHPIFRWLLSLFGIPSNSRNSDERIIIWLFDTINSNSADGHIPTKNLIILQDNSNSLLIIRDVLQLFWRDGQLYQWQLRGILLCLRCFALWISADLLLFWGWIGKNRDWTCRLAALANIF